MRSADLVVLNKCDLAGLGAISGLEDRLHALVPGVRLLRARFGQVPLEAVLDVDLEGCASLSTDGISDNEGGSTGAEPQSSSWAHDGGTSTRPASSAAGEVAFLSHEGFLGQQPQRHKHAAAGENHVQPALGACFARSMTCRQQTAMLMTFLSCSTCVAPRVLQHSTLVFERYPATDEVSTPPTHQHPNHFFAHSSSEKEPSCSDAGVMPAHQQP